MTTQTPVTESELAAAAVAPRLTPDTLQAQIAETWFFTAWEGAQLAYWGTSDPDNPKPVEGEPDKDGPLALLTLCVLVMRNGFTVVGKSACASPENFNADIGRWLAREDAVRQLWSLLGYELRTKLAERTL